MKVCKINKTGVQGMTRRDVLRLGAGVAAGAAVGPFVMRVARAGEAFSWQRFKGSKIFMMFTKNPWGDTMEKLLPEFEKLTGIKVEFADLPELQARQKLPWSSPPVRAASMPGMPACTWRSAASGSRAGSPTSASS